MITVDRQYRHPKITFFFLLSYLLAYNYNFQNTYPYIKSFIEKRKKVKSKQSNKHLLNWTSRSTGTTSSLGNRWTFSVACFSDTNASSKVKLVFAVTLHVQILWRYKFIRFKYSLQYIRLQIRSKAKWWDKNTNTNSIIHQQNPSNNNFQFSEKWKENNTHNPWKSLW